MSGGSLITLQRLLGHSSLSITQIYSNLSDEHIAGEIKKPKSLRLRWQRLTA